ncbi:MAG: hypothetical protein ACXW6J_22695, partial [Candidatus Binatia bacterium]
GPNRTFNASHQIPHQTMQEIMADSCIFTQRGSGLALRQWLLRADTVEKLSGSAKQTLSVSFLTD